MEVYIWVDVARVIRQVIGPCLEVVAPLDEAEEIELHPVVGVCPVCGNFTTQCGGIHTWTLGAWMCTRQIYMHDLSCCFA